MNCLDLHQKLDAAREALDDQIVNDTVIVIFEGKEHGGEFWALDDVRMFGRGASGDHPALCLELRRWKWSEGAGQTDLSLMPTVAEVVTKLTAARSGGGAA